jgi:hypothetical protein
LGPGKVLHPFPVEAGTAEDGVRNLSLEKPPVVAVGATIHVSPFGSDPSVNMHRWIPGVTYFIKILHFLIETCRMPWIQITVVEPEMSHLVKEGVRKERSVSLKVAAVEDDTALEEIGKAKLLPHSAAKLNGQTAGIERSLGLIDKIGSQFGHEGLREILKPSRLLA